MSIQWHITTDCQNRCKHCYVFDPATYDRERTCRLSLEDKLKVMDQIDSFGKKWGFRFPMVALMGGDPLLAPDWYPFAKALRERGKVLSFGGNPETLTPENIARLKELEVKSYQLSLDGLEAAHDAQRRPGSFRNTLEGIEKLAQAGIRVGVMGTLTPLNIQEFWQVADMVYYETKASSFTFDFVAQVGNARGMAVSFTPEQVLELSQRYLDMKQQRKAQRPEFNYGEKPGLFRLLRVARGEYAHYDQGETYPAAGCLIGNNCLCLLSDGTMLSCRRFPQILGRLPQDSLEDILLANPTLKRYRRPQFWKQCGQCMAWGYCRGCPAVSYGSCGDPFGPLPYCYAHLLGLDTHVEHAPIPMDTTREQEAELIKRNLLQTYLDQIISGTIEPEFAKTLLGFCSDQAKEQEFAANPAQWFQTHYPQWDQHKRHLFTARFNALRQGNDFEAFGG